MKAAEIVVGGHYKAKMSDRITIVVVESIDRNFRGETKYHVRNTVTNRTTVFRSAAKFREVAERPLDLDKVKEYAKNIIEGKWTTPNADPTVGLSRLKGMGIDVEGNPSEGENSSDPTGMLKTLANPPTVTDVDVVETSSITDTPNTPQTVGDVDSVATKPQSLQVGSSTKLSQSEGENRPDFPQRLPLPTMPIPIPLEDGKMNEYRAKGEPIVTKRSVTPEEVQSVISNGTKGLLSGLKIGKSANALPPHLIVEARAGTGKTTTLVEGVKIMMRIGTMMIPSPQQKAVWDEMAKSKGVRYICFCAFNSSIAKELERRVPQGCKAATMHSLGLYAVRKSFQLLPGESGVNANRVSNIIAEILNADIRVLRKQHPILVKATTHLVSLCKMNLAHRDATGAELIVDTVNGVLDPDWVEVLDNLRSHYEVEIPSEVREDVYSLVPLVLERCKDVGRDKCVDFNDMIWLPVVLNLPTFVNDVLVVDEAQDLNRCQQALAKMLGKRLILCGDPKQAIYGFAGADAESMNRMLGELIRTPNSCELLPLTVTRRCGKAIVAEAQQIVPDFEAFETNPEGSIKYSRYPTERTKEGNVEVPYDKTYLPLVADGDMILCRANAPLVSQCLKFIKSGRKAKIQGRDIGKGLIDLVDQLKAVDTTDLVYKLSDWMADGITKEMAERNPSENKIQSIEDRAGCLRCFIEGATTVDDVKRKIESIFTDDGKTDGIKLSSIHKAKGLESKRVFFIEGFGMPVDKIKKEWQREQYYNLTYVAITRAIEELVYVT